MTLIIATCVAMMVWSQTITSQQVPVSKPNVADILARLHSRHLSDRIDALDEIASDQTLLHSPKIQVTLMDLLDQENETFREDKSFSTLAVASADDSGEEENSQYLSSLSIVVNMFVDWNDPRQACTMVYAGDIVYPPSTTDAAARARAAMPCLLKRSKSKFAIYRETASPMLVKAIAKAQGTLDTETAEAARKLVLSNLRDADSGVRESTVIALSDFGGTDMIPALQEVAAKDPEPEVDGHSIRKDAAEAIAAIQKRQASSSVQNRMKRKRSAARLWTFRFF
jgi:HEAT repeat protein